MTEKRLDNNTLDISLTRLLGLVGRSKWLIFSLVASGMVLAAAGAHDIKPVYECRARIVVGTIYIDGKLKSLEAPLALGPRLMRKYSATAGGAARLQSTERDKYDEDALTIIVRAETVDAAKIYLSDITADVVSEHRRLYDAAAAKKNASEKFMATSIDFLNRELTRLMTQTGESSVQTLQAGSQTVSVLLDLDRELSKSMYTKIGPTEVVAVTSTGASESRAFIWYVLFGAVGGLIVGVTVALLKGVFRPVARTKKQ